MFDLNIDVCAEYLAYNEAETASGEGSGAFQATEVSGTSDSSVVNVDDGPATVVGGSDDRDSDNSMSALNFDIFRKLRTSTAEVVPDDDDNDVDEVAGNHSQTEFVTWQLFPLKEDSDDCGRGGLSCDSFKLRVSSSETQWLNLSISGSASASGGLEQPEMKIPPQHQQVRRSRRGPRSRSSQYRGVTFYRRTGRWESHIWDCGKQVYLGGFDTAYAAARAYDRAAIKFRGVDADINFVISDYNEDMKQMKNLTKDEFVQTLRRQSSGFPRGSSRYRGATLQKYGQWEAQQTGRYLAEIGQNLDLNLGLSNSSHHSRGNKYIAQGNPHSPFSHPADGRRTMLGSSYWLNSAQSLRAQPLASTSQSAIWPGAPGVSAIHGEEKKVESVGSTRLWNRAWNIEVGHHGGANQVVPLFSSAASSGFSF